MLLRCFSHACLCATLWMIAQQARQSLGFSRQEYWSGWPFLSPGDLPYPDIEPRVSLLSCIDRWVPDNYTIIPSAHGTELLSGVSLFGELETHTEKTTEPPTSGWEKVTEVTQDPRVPDPKGPQTRAPPGWLGPSGPGSTQRDAELPGHPLPAGALGANSK